MRRNRGRIGITMMSFIDQDGMEVGARVRANLRRAPISPSRSARAIPTPRASPGQPTSPGNLAGMIQRGFKALDAKCGKSGKGISLLYSFAVDTEGQNTTALNARFRQNLRMGTMSTTGLRRSRTCPQSGKN